MLGYDYATLHNTPVILRDADITHAAAAAIAYATTVGATLRYYAITLRRMLRLSLFSPPMLYWLGHYYAITCWPLLHTPRAATLRQW